MPEKNSKTLIQRILLFIKELIRHTKNVSRYDRHDYPPDLSETSKPFKTVTQLAKQYGDSARLVQKWCKEHGVPYIGENRGKRYLIYSEYEAQFKKRNRLTGKPGQQAAQKEKTASKEADHA